MIVVALLGVLAVTLAAVALWRQGLPRRRSRVIVTVVTGETFDGSVVSAGAVLRLRAVTGASERGESFPVDGELILRWESVTYVQVP